VASETPLRAVLREVRSGVAQLYIAVGRASFRREVEEVPERLERADVAWIAAGLHSRESGSSVWRCDGFVMRGWMELRRPSTPDGRPNRTDARARLFVSPVASG
jgi:hypothetical protein